MHCKCSAIEDDLERYNNGKVATEKQRLKC